MVISKQKLLKLIRSLVIGILAAIALHFLLFKVLPRHIKAILFGNFPVLERFVQKDFSTYTSITNIKDEMKLVTAKQQLDFINIMDGKDGRYLEIATFEVKAGIDCAKITKKTIENRATEFNFPPVEILSADKIHSLNFRSAAEESAVTFYEEKIKPVNKAYEQKARDYAVELGLLEQGKKGTERTLKNLTDAKIDLQNSAYKQTVEVPYLPFSLEIAESYFREHNMEIVPQEDGIFYRDALTIEPKGDDGWKIRIGDSGRPYSGTFSEFYKNMFDTNCNKDNNGKDKVEIFRYFDPMYPKESEILGYASDNYRTMFLLNNKRIYYVDALVQSDETLIQKIAPTMIYLASSLRKIETKKTPNYEPYKNYVAKFFDLQESLRTNESRIAVKRNTENLLKARLSPVQDSLTQDEKYLTAVSDVKGLGRNKVHENIQKTDDAEFDEITTLIESLLVDPESFKDDEKRENAIETAIDLDTRIYHDKNKKAANVQYLETWFLQNKNLFSLDSKTREKYLDDLQSGEIYIASRPIIARLSDAERNEYFYNLFRNRLSHSHYFADTADSIDRDLKKSVRGSNMFAYFDLPEGEEFSDGEIYEKLKKQNGGHEIENSFILVFNQTQWDFGSLGKDNDIHAFVFDDATLRIFPNVGSENLAEKFISALKINKEPRYFFYGDWQHLRITPESVKINGTSFGKLKFTRKSRNAYRQGDNDFAEKSCIAILIDDLQHAYSSDMNEMNYYYDFLCENLESWVQDYVYEKIFRPSPRLIIDTRADLQNRYNR